MSKSKFPIKPELLRIVVSAAKANDRSITGEINHAIRSHYGAAAELKPKKKRPLNIS